MSKEQYQKHFVSPGENFQDTVEKYAAKSNNPLSAKCYLEIRDLKGDTISGYWNGLFPETMADLFDFSYGQVKEHIGMAKERGYQIPKSCNIVIVDILSNKLCDLALNVPISVFE